MARECASTPECPLHEPTAEAVEKRLFNILESLRTKVVTVYDGVKTLVLIDRKLVLGSVFVGLYQPYETFAALFHAYADLEKGNGTTFYSLLTTYVVNLTVTCQDCYPILPHAGAGPDAGIAIQCGDTGPAPDDLTSLRSVYNAFSAQTSLADIVFSIVVRCVYVVPTPSSSNPPSDISIFL